MDSLTHTLAGTLVARAGFSQRMGKMATVTLTASAVAPDLDYLLRLGGPQFYLAEHRGFTHSFVGIAIMAPLLGLLFSRFDPKRRYWAWTSLSALGIGLHILLDLFTSFGTMVFYPFSKERYAWDLLFIIDPYLSGTIILGIALSYLLKARSTLPARLGLLLLSSYAALAAFNHTQALIRVKAEAKARGLQVLQAAALPLPFSPFRWSGILETPKAIYQGSFSTLERAPLQFVAHPKVNLNGPLKAAEDEAIVKFFRWFARFPIVEVKESNPGLIVEYFDLRFVAIPGRRPFLVQVAFDKKGRIVKSGLVRP